jgi:stage V sporulation protein AF
MEDFAARCHELDTLLGVGRSFDVLGRDISVGDRRGRLWVVMGFVKDELVERLVGALQRMDTLHSPTAESFIARCVNIADAKAERAEQTILMGVFSGKTLLLIEGYDAAILLEAKTYPTRAVSEPDTSKVLRGSHDGFTENIMQNAALLRRRIRTPALTLEHHRIGGRSGCDVVLAYVAGEAEEAQLQCLRKKLAAIDVGSIAMSQESVAECIVPRQWWNPFPKIRYTERPDVATATAMEGGILLMVDNSASVMLLPTSLLSFAEEINDYYFPPLVGSYLQLVRIVVLVMTVFITPLWYLLVKDPGRLHENLHFLLIQDEYYVPLIVQLLLVELIVDLLKLASLNTPNALSSSFSMLGALILGDFAVQARWLVPEVLVYMAFVAIANFAQPSFELGYALKLMRMLLLLLSAWLDVWGLAAGLLLLSVLLASTKPILSRGYLYPLIPFNATALGRILVRRPIDRDNS